MPKSAATEKPRMLYRSKTNRVIAGVCGGIGEYFNVDPVIIRILWVIFSIAGGAGVFAYIICWILIPEKGEKPWWESKAKTGKPSTETPVELFGILLIALGAWFLLSNLGLLWWANIGYLWPAAIIIVGVIVIILSRKERK